MNNFIKIYFWQVISILFNFASIFVVTPYISSNQALYGIYAIVVSAYLFISYADFGFLSASMKYAAESFAQKNILNEIKVIGFATMVFLIFILIYAIGIFLISFSPGILVNNLKSETEILIARNLLQILAFFCPVFALQRIVQIIFGVRLQDYKFQRILIICNLIKVLSVFYFFRNGKYLIVEYFLFSQLCTLVAVVIGLFIAKKKLGYDLELLFKSVKLSKEQYDKTKKLAYTSLFLTFSWILYYELDTFVIAKFLGPNSVAIFAIALTIMTYFRTLFGVFFSPFIAKFNHFVGLRDSEGLKKFFFKVLLVFVPITTLPVLCVVLTTKNFILTWVGSDYELSVQIAQVMLLSYLFSFITYPAGILIMANEDVKALYLTSAIQPFIYWLGIIITYSFLKLEAFAYFKFIAFFIEAVVYIVYVVYFFKITFFTFFKKVILPIIPAFVSVCGLIYFSRSFWPITHNKINLFLYFTYIGIVVAAGLLIVYFTSDPYKLFVKNVYKNAINRFYNIKTN